jgi:hypothetical protein
MTAGHDPVGGGSVPHAAAPGLFPTATTLVLDGLGPLAGRDWRAPAGELAWDCRQTADHLVDCLLSYALQLAARRAGDWLPVEEVHVAAGATPRDLLDALAAACRTLSAVLAASPPDAAASDGVVPLDVAGWDARGTYELVVHGHDLATGLGGAVVPPEALCAAVLASPALWMLDRDRAGTAAGSWEALLLASGRTAPSP